MVLSGETVGAGWAVHQPNRPILPGARVPERIENSRQGKDRGQRTEGTGERDVTQKPTRPHTVGRLDYNVSCADEAGIHPVSLVSSGLRCAVM